MPLKRLTWSKTRGTARECQPAARGCRPALHLAAAAAAALPCPAHSRGPDASPRPAAARLHLRKPPRPPRQPQPGPAFEGRREPGAPRGWAGANPHLRLLLPSPRTLSRPGPLPRRPRRPAPPQLSRSRRGLACSARGLYTRAPLPAPARARNLVPPDTASFRCPRPGRSRPRPGDVCSWPSCGGKSVTRGRVLPAIAQTAGHQVGPV